MNSPRPFRSLVGVIGVAMLSVHVGAPVACAYETARQHLHFQKPGDGARGSGKQQNFRRPGQKPQGDLRPPARAVDSARQSVKTTKPKRKKQVISSEPQAAQRTATKVARRDRRVKPISDDQAKEEALPQPKLTVDEVAAEPDPPVSGPVVTDGWPPAYYDAAHRVGEPACGICEPGCGFAEPSCGCVEPSCGCVEPSCGIVEPGCGVAEPGCGSCVGSPGPDYWCFPICLPRFKDATVWVGTQGFRGPRDFIPAPESNSNFGFNAGFNLSGRAPLVGLLFPQLSYQLGYQSVVSRLDGTTVTTDDRAQDFFTVGLFRRVHSGLQFGAVWDSMSDNLERNIDLQQIRSEISLKSPRGREIGFWSAASTNNRFALGGVYQAVDQYAVFYRWNCGKGSEARLWGGSTGDGEGIFGGEFYAPLNDRFSLRSSFNYLNPKPSTAPAAVRQESWNVGINLVWHLGRTARRGCRSPYRPLFAVADNGWMFVDAVD